MSFVDIPLPVSAKPNLSGKIFPSPTKILRLTQHIIHFTFRENYWTFFWCKFYWILHKFIIRILFKTFSFRTGLEIFWRYLRFYDLLFTMQPIFQSAGKSGSAKPVFKQRRQLSEGGEGGYRSWPYFIQFIIVQLLTKSWDAHTITEKNRYISTTWGRS